VVKQNVDGSVGRHGVRRGSPVGCDRGKVDCVFRDPRPHLLQFQRLCRRILYPWARDVAGESDLQALLDVCVQMGLRFSQVYCRALQVKRAWCCHSAPVRRFA